MDARPVICEECGALYIEHETGDCCPACSNGSTHDVRIPWNDSRSLLLRALTIRAEKEGIESSDDGGIPEKPTQREKSILRTGDEMILDEWRWQIRSMEEECVTLIKSPASPAFAESDPGGWVIGRIPEIISPEALAILDRRTAELNQILPISCAKGADSNGRREVVALSSGQLDVEDEIAFSHSGFDWVFWNAAERLIDSSIAACYPRPACTVYHCGRSTLICEKEWKELETTNLPEVRFCSDCDRRIFMSFNWQEGIFYHENGHGFSPASSHIDVVAITA